MKLTELKRGMRITLRYGKIELFDYISNYEGSTLLFTINEPWAYGEYNDDMTNRSNSNYDIVKVEDLVGGSYYVSDGIENASFRTIWERDFCPRKGD